MLRISPDMANFLPMVTIASEIAVCVLWWLLLLLLALDAAQWLVGTCTPSLLLVISRPSVRNTCEYVYCHLA